MKNIPVLVDGPNYINRVIELGIDPVHIARQLSLEGLMQVINEKIHESDRLSGRCESAEFICSKKRFGPKDKKFTDEQQKLLLDRLRGETGVYVDIVDIPGSSEKGIDMTVSGKIEDYAHDVDAVVLVSADRDFIPTIKKLRHKVKIILIALGENYPIELQNEGYTTLFLHEDYRGLFRYGYPRYYIKDFDVEKCADLYSEADDRLFNQVRMTHDGYVYISIKVGMEDLYDVKVRWETCVAYNGYVGPKAASDSEYIKEEHKEIKLAWKRGAKGYLDCPVDWIWKENKDV